MIGSIDYRQGEILGAITSNNENGIFGSLAEEVCLYDEQQALPVGYKQDIEKVRPVSGAVWMEPLKIMPWK